MRVILCIVCALFVFNQLCSQEPQKKPAKESLVYQHAKESVDVLCGFPYPDTKYGLEVAEMVVALLNSAEKVYDEAQRLKDKDGSDAEMVFSRAMIAHDLRLFRFMLKWKQLEWTEANKLPKAKYVIRWDGMKWFAVEIGPAPKKVTK